MIFVGCVLRDASFLVVGVSFCLMMSCFSVSSNLNTAFSVQPRIKVGKRTQWALFQSNREFNEQRTVPKTLNKSSVKEIAGKYSSFLIDQFGVIHNGTHPYEGAIEVIEELAREGKKMVILSNSSKRKGVAVKNLRKMGFNPDLFCEIVTSGNTAFDAMMERKTEPFQSLGTKCLVLGNGDDDEEYVEQMDCSISSIEDAEFLLARGNFVVHDSNGVTKCDRSPSSEEYVQQILRAASERQLPMLVTNPDVLRPGCNSPMPGILGEKYAQLGGQVHYVGKPHMDVYEKCIEALGENGKDRSKICAIGDSLDHDILGASQANIDSIFIIGGVHSSELKIEQGKRQVPENEDLEKLYEGHGNVRPTYAIPACTW
mmetsp:Transcript_18323/g.24175  ORF Transcript_18323/g.24175 Transcript_18323/m.24175 type:complete len:372 (+) Transcript_18323:70-1185(+)|eukprot:CAMPEP_0117757506 /NCGR_PEP_ID=MMETSP0947-20121206/14779_1 /TAXON_ID=44440 /ORGANISM="Chattonella subsalsa, Strain CCMP2191" /LENGTH=371 /DNA_ID=CAMNT_0005577427 /DNA_START=60 /DNA_END=1175 /DNA_ORIENTATION=+